MVDFLFGIVVLICNLVFYFVDVGGIVINDFYCKIIGGVVYFGCGVFVFILVVIVLERYGVVVKLVCVRVWMCDFKRYCKIV